MSSQGLCFPVSLEVWCLELLFPATVKFDFPPAELFPAWCLELQFPGSWNLGSSLIRGCRVSSPALSH